MEIISPQNDNDFERFPLLNIGQIPGTMETIPEKVLLASEKNKRKILKCWGFLWLVDSF